MKPIYNWKWNQLIIKNLKNETKLDIGFIAHELQDVIPEVVTGEKDEVDANGVEVHQGVDYAKLTVVLTKALQEAVARIEALEAKLGEVNGN